MGAQMKAGRHKTERLSTNHGPSRALQELFKCEASVDMDAGAVQFSPRSVQCGNEAS